jgi:hypothetical protein
VGSCEEGVDEVVEEKRDASLSFPDQDNEPDNGDRLSQLERRLLLLQQAVRLLAHELGEQHRCAR